MNRCKEQGARIGTEHHHRFFNGVTAAMVPAECLYDQRDLHHHACNYSGCRGSIVVSRIDRCLMSGKLVKHRLQIAWAKGLRLSVHCAFDISSTHDTTFVTSTRTHCSCSSSKLNLYRRDCCTQGCTATYAEPIAKKSANIAHLIVVRLNTHLAECIALKTHTGCINSTHCDCVWHHIWCFCSLQESALFAARRKKGRRIWF
jgi:hypothetical protein